jgi:hypothetical protein
MQPLRLEVAPHSNLLPQIRCKNIGAQPSIVCVSFCVVVNELRNSGVETRLGTGLALWSLQTSLAENEAAAAVLFSPTKKGS